VSGTWLETAPEAARRYYLWARSDGSQLVQPAMRTRRASPSPVRRP